MRANKFPIQTALMFALTLGCCSPAASGDSLVTLEWPAAGRSEAVIELPEPGRYSFQVSSESGVAIEVVDKVAGPLGRDGVAGERDGRVDLLLDADRVLVRARGLETVAGEAKLEVFLVREIHPEPAPELVELRPVDDPLEDLQARSWWIEIKDRQPIWIEAGGRHLEDLRLWRDGEWLDPYLPAVRTRDPFVGRPLRIFTIAAPLEPGVYKIIAYGGAGLAWAERSDEAPFWMRWGIPERPMTGRTQIELNPLGFERFMFTRRSNHFRAELPVREPFEMAIQNWENYNLGGRIDRVALHEKSRQPVLTLDVSHGRERPGQQPSLRVVTLEGLPSQKLNFEHFEELDWYQVDGPGCCFHIASLHSGASRDSIEASALLIAFPPTGRPYLAASDLIELGIDGSWSARFNLLGRASLFVKIDAAGSWQPRLLDGPESRMRFQPFQVFRPEGYREPDFRAAGEVWELDQGYWELEIDPVKPGIVTISLGPEGAEVPEPSIARGSIRIQDFNFRPSTGYRLYLGQQPELHRGAFVRRQALNLSDAMPLGLRPAETVELKIRVSEDGWFRSVDDRGQPFAVEISGQGTGSELRLLAGDYTLRATNPGQTSVLLSLGVVADRLDPTRPLEPFRRAHQGPVMPTISPGERHAIELDRGERLAYEVEVAEAGLYRLETSGLLATSGRLQSRSVTDLAKAIDGGAGRNFRIDAWLLPGRYLLETTTMGQSAGHGYLQLSRRMPTELGALPVGGSVHRVLEAGEAGVWDLQIAAGDQARLVASSLGAPARWRIEDPGGWPIGVPGRSNEVLLEGADRPVRAVLLAEALEGRRALRLDPVEPVRDLSGHGPFALDFDQRERHLWRESPERMPDRWSFTLDAPAQVVIAHESSMTAEAVFGDGTVVEVANGVAVELAAGEWELHLRAAARDDRRPYWLELRPSALLPGMERALSEGGRMPVVLGEHDLVEISSSGSEDLAARLVDSSGHVVAASDDRPEGWGFLIAGHFEPGSYELQVDRLSRTGASRLVAHFEGGDGEAATSIAMGQPIAGAIDSPGEVDLFQVHVVAGSQIEIETRAPEAGGTVDTVLWACTAQSPHCTQENALIMDDDGGEGSYSRLRLRRETSEWLNVVVAGYGENNGPYVLEASASGAPSRQVMRGSLVRLEASSLSDGGVLEIGHLEISPEPSRFELPSDVGALELLLSSADPLEIAFADRSGRVDRRAGRELRMVIANPAGASLTVRGLEARDQPISIDARWLEIRDASEAELATGLRPGSDAVIRLMTTRGSLRFARPDGLVVGRSGEALAPVARSTGTVGVDDELWIAGDASSTARAERLVLGSTVSLEVGPTAAVIDLAPGDGRLVHARSRSGQPLLGWPGGPHDLSTATDGEAWLWLDDQSEVEVWFGDGDRGIVDLEIHDIWYHLVLYEDDTIVGFSDIQNALDSFVVVDVFSGECPAAEVVSRNALVLREFEGHHQALQVSSSAPSSLVTNPHEGLSLIGLGEGSSFSVECVAELPVTLPAVLQASSSWRILDAFERPIVSVGSLVTSFDDGRLAHADGAASSATRIEIPPTISSVVVFDPADFEGANGVELAQGFAGLRDLVATGRLVTRGQRGDAVLERGMSRWVLPGEQIRYLPLDKEATLRIEESAISQMVHDELQGFLVPVGRARAVEIEIARASRLGAGISSTEPAVILRLVDDSGAEVASGRALFEDLPSGHYYLVIDAAEATAPAWVELAIVGLDDPGDGPPEETLKSFFTSER